MCVCVENVSVCVIVSMCELLGQSRGGDWHWRVAGLIVNYKVTKLNATNTLSLSLSYLLLLWTEPIGFKLKTSPQPRPGGELDAALDPDPGPNLHPALSTQHCSARPSIYFHTLNALVFWVVAIGKYTFECTLLFLYNCSSYTHGIETSSSSSLTINIYL